ncbi:uncharacterized protein DUF2505 [Motilibacter rhizosphaerae]|uniref:Uncharacterized protein DUF2505 n=1 Tax=Motilibacter rhizosphaerae TaxID=598652 RepID=A0A4Q7NNP5_9ACTN|nr:DUF2505 domain-containing protein [Motilibacter rhizosphaerae]RZS86859.1 uncharacterized protein DUF2505 [Motilibacter rhizosphaerae]
MKKVDYSGEVPRSPEDVYAALTSPEFWRSYATSHRLAAPTVETVQEGGATVTRMSSRVGVPSQARALAGDSADVSTTTRWSTPSAGDLRVDVAAKQKADVTGTITLTPAASGTRLAFSGELNVRVPFLGGVAEGQAVKYVPQAFADLAKTLTSWQQ